MLQIITKNNFKTIPWKNGKGQTTELAISENGSLEKFDWRLSIATVVEDGVFSNFSGYERNLVLIEGNGLTLTHDIIHTDRLVKLLDVATFDGSSSTHAEIINGSIKDFNIMTAKSTCQAKVETYPNFAEFTIDFKGLVFVYSLSSVITITHQSTNKQSVKQGDLLKLENPKGLFITAKSFIVIYFTF